MSPILERQLRELVDRFGGAEARGLPSRTTLVSVPGVPLPPGWSSEHTSVHFLVPVGYPLAALDCFWAGNDLRLASGLVPKNAAADNVIPEAGFMGLWFSWHLTGPWDPNRDTLSSWMNVIADRMRRPQ
ncbi:E2 family protein E [Mesorhizobium albiziae]|uniref:E2 family protein E n=1 Tax=Neomesorhizobium albiziae TaxID=335020 RepID=A0A1I4F9N6_9HYPH|nr:E2/UBC family protein [Mesorhizobium albiziae]GLS33069.1 hypothetical protein GCM10007937_47800 [Mesorhizobium albiziae]SFL14594.1 E2 family protein E [Mesorhizobium albiziae]